MRIAIIVEGATEKAFKESLRTFLGHKDRLAGKMPSLRFLPQDGRIPKENKLKRLVDLLLSEGYDAVIALTDVYTGTNDFVSAEDAKLKMANWVQNENFYPHAAQYDFEAWLLPYWDIIKQKSQHNRVAPGGNPELVNHGNPPSKRIKEVFETGKSPRSYSKIRDAQIILNGQDLMVSIRECSELKAFVNTIISLSGGTTVG